MTEPAAKIEEETLEHSVDAAIAACDGDVRAALTAALIYNSFLERKLDQFRGMISSGFTRGRVTPPQKASEMVDRWRQIAVTDKT